MMPQPRLTDPPLKAKLQKLSFEGDVMGAFAVLAVLLVAVQAVFLGKVPTVELDLDAPAADR